MRDESFTISPIVQLLLDTQTFEGGTQRDPYQSPGGQHSLVRGQHSDPAGDQAASGTNDNSPDQLPHEVRDRGQQQEKYETSSGTVRLPGADDITSAKQVEESAQLSEEATEDTHLCTTPLGETRGGPPEPPEKSPEHVGHNQITHDGHSKGPSDLDQEDWGPELRIALASLQDIGSWYDIPYAEKLKYLNMAVDKHPELGAEGSAHGGASWEVPR